MAQQPLAEVFGFPISNFGPEAVRHRNQRLCRFGNRIPACTKDKASNPLGVCSILADREVVITCPIRFRENWLIAQDAASFFFAPETKWSILTEVRLTDVNGKAAGNIDIVLVSCDSAGRVTDFGALEVQSVYISGNVRKPFEHYMEDPQRHATMEWSSRVNSPRPDYLSSSRKRLAPQLLFKGGIFKAWNRKVAVALDRGFFHTLPRLAHVDPAEAEMAWFVYELVLDSSQNLYRLRRWRSVYTMFEESLDKITRSQAGAVVDFIEQLQRKVDKEAQNPNAPGREPSDDLF